MPFRVLVAWVLGGGEGGGARRLGLVFVVLETKHASRSWPTPKSPKALEKNGLPIQHNAHHNRWNYNCITIAAAVHSRMPGAVF